MFFSHQHCHSNKTSWMSCAWLHDWIQETQKVVFCINMGLIWEFIIIVFFPPEMPNLWLESLFYWNFLYSKFTSVYCFSFPQQSEAAPWEETTEEINNSHNTSFSHEKECQKSEKVVA